MTKSSKKKPGQTPDPSVSEEKARKRRIAPLTTERDPADYTDRAKANAPQCVAVKKNGKRCKAAPIHGARVCRVHGGATAHVRAKAEQRLLAAADQLMASLLEIALDKSQPAMVRLAAIRDALNRAGLDHKGITVQAPDDPWAELTAAAIVVERDLDIAIDPIDEMTLQASALHGIARQENEEAWTAYDREDVVTRSRRIHPDERTVRGEVIESDSPISFGNESAAPLGGSEMDPLPRLQTREEIVLERFGEDRVPRRP